MGIGIERGDPQHAGGLDVGELIGPSWGSHEGESHGKGTENKTTKT